MTPQPWKAIASGTTVTTNEQESWFWPASVAVHVTVFLPAGKNEPFGGVQDTLGLGQLSSTVAETKLKTAPHCPSSFGSIASGRQVIEGGVVSPTVTVKPQVAAQPSGPVAVQVTAVVPFGNAVPLAGLQLTVVPSGPVTAGCPKSTFGLHCDSRLGGQAMVTG